MRIPTTIRITVAPIVRQPYSKNEFVMILWKKRYIHRTTDSQQLALSERRTFYHLAIRVATKIAVAASFLNGLAIAACGAVDFDSGESLQWSPPVSGLPLTVVAWLNTDSVNGVPKVDVTHVNGTPASVISGSVNANVTELDGDATAADNARAAFDGTGYNVGGGKIVSVDLTGYNNILHVGPGQTFSTIAAAEAAAAAGDLIRVHRATYTETQIGKNDVTYYLDPGVTLDGAASTTPTFDATIQRFRVLGSGKIIQPNDAAIFTQPSFSDVAIECDTIDLADGNNLYSFSNSHASNRLRIRAKRVMSQYNFPFLKCSAGRTKLNAESVDLEAEALEVTGSTAIVTLCAANVKSTAPLIKSTSTGGTVFLKGVYENTSTSGSGLIAPSGVTLFALSGAVKVGAGGTSFSGSGAIYVNDAFSYDAAASTASNVIRTVAGSAVLANTRIASLTSQTNFTLAAGPPDNDALNGALVVITDATNSMQKAVGVVLDYVGSSRTVTLAANPGIFAMASGDKVDVIALEP